MNLSCQYFSSLKMKTLTDHCTIKLKSETIFRLQSSILVQSNRNEKNIKLTFPTIRRSQQKVSKCKGIFVVHHIQEQNHIVGIGTFQQFKSLFYSYRDCIRKFSRIFHILLFHLILYTYNRPRNSFTLLLKYFWVYITLHSWIIY